MLFPILKTHSFIPTAMSDLSPNALPSIADGYTALLLGVVLSATGPAIEEEDAMFKVVDSAGKGFGVIAAKPIERGTIILSERPLCIWPQSLTVESARNHFEQLSTTQQEAYMELCPAVEGLQGVENEILSRRAANGFAITLPSLAEGMRIPGFAEDEETTLGFVFSRVSRFNHSCLPNAQHAIDFTTLRMEIYAVEPIPSNKEIAIEYLPGLLTLTRAERSDALRESFGFPRCLCTACTGSEELGVESDRRRVEIKRVVGELKGEADRATKMGLLEEMRVLLAEEKYIGPPEFADMGVSSMYSMYLQMWAARNAAPTVSDEED